MDGLLQKLLKHSDLAAAVAVVIVVVMMVVPLPAVAARPDHHAQHRRRARDRHRDDVRAARRSTSRSFPSLLLLTTLLRLAINVSVTRLILLHGDAGDVIHAFGNFVVGGNLVVGLVVFFILVVIQFVVITNGAGRVAEVAARFTLDAMPGKQMAIDADLNAGQITDERGARAPQGDLARGRLLRRDGRRLEVRQGRRDGRRRDRRDQPRRRHRRRRASSTTWPSIARRMHTFSLLTVGDGLAAQIPALLISTATGIIVTRSGSEQDLGTEITGQISASRRRSSSPAASIVLMGLVPGPAEDSVLRRRRPARSRRPHDRRAAVAAEAEPQRDRARAAQELRAPVGDAAVGALAIDPLELAIGFGLVPLVDQRSGGDAARARRRRPPPDRRRSSAS